MTDVKAELLSDLDEQVAIRDALIRAIPHNVRYSNLVLALKDLLKTFTSQEAIAIIEDAMDADAADGRKRGER